MKLRAFAILLSFAATIPVFASETAPSLKDLLTAAEWKRAGLDRLSPDEIGVIDAALIRNNVRLRQAHETELAAARAAIPVAGTEAVAAEKKRSFLQRFGLPTFDEVNWRDIPPLQAKVTEWVSANRFKLDNGQVWEGVDNITYELAGKSIEIQARPHGQFALIVEGQNTTLRIMRLR
jgi:hypothetical protein